MAKYLDELSNGRAIWPFDESNYPNIHEEYGFDERETFDLTYFFGRDHVRTLAIFSRSSKQNS